MNTITQEMKQRQKVEGVKQWNDEMRGLIKPYKALLWLTKCTKKSLRLENRNEGLHSIRSLHESRTLIAPDMAFEFVVKFKEIQIDSRFKWVTMTSL